jgi:predicted Zn-dependent protease with MMP-like domain
MNVRLPPPTRRGTMTLRQFERVVDEVIETLPKWVVDRVDNLRIVVEDWPTRDQDPDGSGFLGLYQGVSLLERSADYFATAPDTITVFRGPHLDLGLGRPGLKREIHRTVLHEMAHHLGIDDDRLHDLGYD